MVTNNCKFASVTTLIITVRNRMMPSQHGLVRAWHLPLCLPPSILLREHQPGHSHTITTTQKDGGKTEGTFWLSNEVTQKRCGWLELRYGVHCYQAKECELKVANKDQIFEQVT